MELSLDHKTAVSCGAKGLFLSLLTFADRPAFSQLLADISMQHVGRLHASDAPFNDGTVNSQGRLLPLLHDDSKEVLACINENAAKAPAAAFALAASVVRGLDMNGSCLELSTLLEAILR